MKATSSERLDLSSAPTGRTLYIKNLNDKLKKQRLKRYLYALCMSYGRIIDIVALKTMKMRGQAFVVFEDTSASSLALKALQGFIFFGKPMRISYAKTVSKTDPDYLELQDASQEAPSKRKKIENINDSNQDNEEAFDPDRPEKDAGHEHPMLC